MGSRRMSPWAIVLGVLFSVAIVGGWLAFLSGSYHGPVLVPIKPALVIVFLPLIILFAIFGIRSRKEQSRSHKQHPVWRPEMFWLPYRAGTPDTSYAPERWSTTYQQKSVRRGLSKLRDHWASMAAECAWLKKERCPDAIYQSAYEHEVQALLTHMISHKDHYDNLLHLHHKGELDYLGDWFETNGFFPRYQAQEALERLKKKYNVQLSNPLGSEPIGEIELSFRSVFFNKTNSDHERLLETLMRQRSCTREQAMQYAIEKLQYDTRSWR